MSCKRGYLRIISVAVGRSVAIHRLRSSLICSISDSSSSLLAAVGRLSRSRRSASVADEHSGTGLLQMQTVKFEIVLLSTSCLLNYILSEQELLLTIQCYHYDVSLNVYDSSISGQTLTYKHQYCRRQNITLVVESE